MKTCDRLNYRGILALLRLFLAGSEGVGFAQSYESVSLLPARDNTLYESADGSLSNAFGDFVFVGKTNQGVGQQLRRAVMAFDFSEIPDGVEVVSAELRLYMDQTIAGDVPIYLYALLADWGEGAADGSGVGGEGAGVNALAGDATWIHRAYATAFWDTAGGDFESCASAGTVVGSGRGYYSWRGPGMVEDVRRWIANPGRDFGWLLKADESLPAPTAKRFVSKDSIFDFLRLPELIVTYQTDGSSVLPPAVVGGGTVAGADYSVTVEEAEAGCLYFMEGSDDMECWLPVLTANGVAGPSGGGSLVLTATGEAVMRKRFYRVRPMVLVP
ncbi:MAG: DNRLRE domain-containing protein [Verrucomicrobiota bacterium]